MKCDRVNRHFPGGNVLARKRTLVRKLGALSTAIKPKPPFNHEQAAPFRQTPPRRPAASQVTSAGDQLGLIGRDPAKAWTDRRRSQLVRCLQAAPNPSLEPCLSRAAFKQARASHAASKPSPHTSQAVRRFNRCRGLAITTHTNKTTRFVHPRPRLALLASSTLAQAVERRYLESFLPAAETQ